MQAIRLASAMLCFPAFVCLTHGQVITTFAGTEPFFPSDPPPPAQAPIGQPWALTKDASGNLYMVDATHNQILRFTANFGQVSVFAGNGIAGYSGDGGDARSASLNGPRAIAFAPNGALYVADAGNHRIRRIEPNGIITTVAGTGRPGAGADAVDALTSALNAPHGVAVDGTGRVYVSDTNNHRIRRLDLDGRIRNFAGSGAPGSAGDNVPALQAQFRFPLAIHFDAAGNLFIADDNNKLIRRVDSQGTLRTVAGTTVDGFAGDGQSATQAAFRGPRDARPDSDGGFYIADHFNSRVRRVNASGIINTVAGNGAVGFSGDGGPATSAQLARPNATLPEGSNTFLIADALSRRLRRVTAGSINTVAGIGLPPTPANLPKESVLLGNATAVRLDAQGNVYLTDREYSRIIRIATSGVVTTIAGTGVPGFSGDNGPAANAQLNAPFGLAIAPDRTIYFSEFEGDRIRKIDPNGVISTVAGTGVQGFNGDGPALQRFVNHSRSLALDTAGNLYIADFGNNRIRRLTPSGNLETVAGTGVQCPENRTLCFNGDNRSALDTNLHWPSGIVFAGNNTFYISDTENHVVRRFTVGGNMNIVAGNGQEGFAGDNGPATAARLNRPTDLALDSAGNLYIADTGNHVVRVVNQSGVIRTFAGTTQGGYSGDGGLANAAWLNSPIGLTFDSQQNLLIGDSGNGRIRQVLAAAPEVFAPSATSISLNGVSLGNETSQRTVNLSGSLAGLRYSVAKGDNAPWLMTSATEGVLPSALRIWADPSNLEPGRYQANLVIATPTGRPVARTIAVNLTVEPPVPPKISSSRPSVHITTFRGDQPSTATLAISVEGSGAVDLNYAVESSAGKDWLRLETTPGVATPKQPAAISLSANPKDLAPNTYSATIVVRGRGAVGGEEQTLRIPVSLLVSEPRSQLTISKEALSFDVLAGSAAGPEQVIHILNTGQGSMNWTASVETLSGGQWLRIGANSGTVVRANLDVGALPVTVDARNLQPGTYFGTVRVIDTSRPSQPRFSVVQVTVLPGGSTLPPEAAPSALVFSGQPAQRPGSQSVTITNRRATAISFSTILIAPGRPWLRTSPGSASIPAGGRIQVAVQPDFEQLPNGITVGGVQFSFDDGSSQTIDVLAAVSAGAITSTKELQLHSAACSPNLNIRLVSHQAPVRVRFGQPFNLEVNVTDDCGRTIAPGTGGVSAAQFSTGEPGGQFIQAGGGNWARSLVVNSDGARTAQGSTVRIKTVATGPGGTLAAGALDVPITVLPATAAAAPQVAAGVNGANYEQNAPLAPGGVITLFGQELGPEQGVQPPAGGEPATNLEGTEVMVGDRRMPLFYASKAQINAQIPFDVDENSLLQVRVRRGDAMSVPTLIPIAVSRPAVFTVNRTGQGLADAFNQDGSRNGPDSAAPEGSVVTIICTGLGRLNPPIPAGRPAPMSPLSHTVNPVSALVNGIEASIQFAGAAPGFTGAYQVNLFIPPGAAASPEASLVLRMEGQESLPVIIHVRGSNP